MTVELASEKAQRRSFTGDKLDWMTAVAADPRVDARGFEVAFCIAQHVNRETGVAILSDETISEKTSIPRRWVARARASLRAFRWIDWKRTKTANIYWTLGDPMNVVLDHQLALREARQERRQERRSKRQDVPRVAYLKSRDVPPLADAELPPMADRDLPPVANIHLSSYTVEVTPSEGGLPKKSDEGV